MDCARKGFSHPIYETVNPCLLAPPTCAHVVAGWLRQLEDFVALALGELIEQSFIGLGNNRASVLWLASTGYILRKRRQQPKRLSFVHSILTHSAFVVRSLFQSLHRRCIVQSSYHFVGLDLSVD